MSDLRVKLLPHQWEMAKELALKWNCRKADGSADVPEMVRLICAGFIPVGSGRGPVAGKKVESSTDRKKFKFWPTAPPQWWRDEGLKSGLMDLSVVLKKTGWTRDELVADGWKCTDLVARAPWPCWGPRVPAWWVDSDEMEGMLVESVPGGLEAVAAAGMTVVGGMVMPPVNGPAEMPKAVTLKAGKKGGRK